MCQTVLGTFVYTLIDLIPHKKLHEVGTYSHFSDTESKAEMLNILPLKAYAAIL